jgi:flagellar assembly factor FliW
MQIVNYKDFDTTIFEDESELILLKIDQINMWVTPKYWKEQKRQMDLWVNSPEYLEMEYKLWFGKDGN